MPLLEKNSKVLLFPQGSLILVTGANGSVASNIITEALANGFRVRGTVRSASSIPSLTALYHSPLYSTVVIPDFKISDAFDTAVDSVSAIIHTATKLPGPVDPSEIVPETITSMQNILLSASKTPSVKRIVYTGTIPIAFKPNQPYKLDRTSWADEAVAASEAPPPYGPDRIFANYKAAKDGAEKQMFAFVNKNEGLGFSVNSVLPCCIFGRMVAKPSETGEWPRELLRGNWPAGAGVGQWYVNMTDVARLHLAAAIDATITNERFLAAAAPFNWNELVDVVQKIAPDAKVAAHLEDPSIDIGVVDNQPGAEALKKWFGQDGWTGLEVSIRENLEGEKGVTT
ncbi:hypothetical protein VTL71DRAFT_784 [Oculimacula yallundae]|uniref:NAD(P)-binding domain-containing protein n=1 Tax=Oculimacula yallundae TaxID=86028 RepID=A0ABR4D3A9_9HELO